MVDSGSIHSGGRRIALRGWDSNSGGSDGISAQFSDQVSSDTEVENGASESEGNSYSELESELGSGHSNVGQSKTILKFDQDTFLTQGKNDVYDAHDLTTTSSESSLIQATKNGDIPLVKSLIGKGCDLDATDSNRRTALHVACSLGRLGIMRLLVGGGANVDASSVQGQTPLHEACVNGRYTILQEMASEVVDLDMVDASGLSAAHYCALNGEVKCLTLLCNQVRTGWVYSSAGVLCTES